MEESSGLRAPMLEALNDSVESINDKLPRNPDAEMPVPEGYTIERRLDGKSVRGKLKYLVKWSGYGHEDNTWEPVEELHQDLVAEHDAAHRF